MSRRAEFVLKNAKGRVLDVGYACGTLHERLAKKLGKKNVYGIDIEEKIKDARHKKSTAEKIPFKKGFFDCVVAGELIEHLEKPERFIKECRRVLKKGGLIIITTPNKKSWVNRLAKSYETKVHISLFDEEELVEMLSRNGFKVKEVCFFPYCEESNYGSRLKWSFALRKCIHKIMPKKLKENMALLAERQV